MRENERVTNWSTEGRCLANLAAFVGPRNVLAGDRAQEQTQSLGIPSFTASFLFWLLSRELVP